ncbi:hypothetical protein TIFTF001_006174 [Ficus carica]|uniref:Uncharacterized protein n=1 Tax=Ficus carica TaxID=3494 RepID=A0AA87ZI65_FICCA|nr:hypothetical protein TIFTF001_006174 [Ficus carica]
MWDLISISCGSSFKLCALHGHTQLPLRGREIRYIGHDQGTEEGEGDKVCWRRRQLLEGHATTIWDSDGHGVLQHPPANSMCPLHHSPLGYKT